MQQCLFCVHTVALVHVHGHYQCPVCGTNALPCCDGDNCDTNLLPYPDPAEQAPAPNAGERTHRVE
ncbi:MAG TPA: hypothetical protein PKE63_02950 [Lacibacter sp.]|nr:hypothetical protein [Lacibacter sp.]HMO88531.1 hypothetical protein [Lacibacter sp.]HMP86204.1 hypothetical protein [Lacibacter sp.]